MNDQGRFDFVPTPSSVEKFERFHVKNPHVYQLFKRYALEASIRERRFSARTIIHRMRWFTQVETDDPDGFKINDHWSPYYARMFVEDFPQYEHFVERRTAPKADQL